jgi:hypothetical protein
MEAKVDNLISLEWRSVTMGNLEIENLASSGLDKLNEQLQVILLIVNNFILYRRIHRFLDRPLDKKNCQ